MRFAVPPFWTNMLFICLGFSRKEKFGDEDLFKCLGTVHWVLGVWGLPLRARQLGFHSGQAKMHQHFIDKKIKQGQPSSVTHIHEVRAMRSEVRTVVPL